MFLGNDNKIRKIICSVCNHVLNAASQVNGNKMPAPDDITLCIGCGNIAVFNDDLELRQPTLEESIKLKKNKNLMHIQEIIFSVKKFH